jgi:MFS family permease
LKPPGSAVTPGSLASALPRTVVALGLVSLANDAASEMVTPLLPVFLTATLGAGPAVVGLIEGVAEATASILKVVSGRLADRGTGAKRLVLAGYGASTVARPLIGLALGWSWVLGLRFLDRVGKGIRTAPRDAMIAAAVPTAVLGRAFGFHRAMDHAGAVVGPLAAFSLLALGADLEHVFLWSIVPGAIVLGVILFGLPADGPARVSVPPPLSFRALDLRLRALLLAAGLLALAALPEVFMVLWATASGLPIAMVPLAWALASAVKMLIAMPAGQLSDRFGRIPVLLAGWSLRVALLLLLATIVTTGAWVWVLFVAYSASLAVTEAPERSLVGDAAPSGLKGTAFGVYHFVTGMFALPGAFMLGLIWQEFGASAAFRTAAGVTVAAAMVMILTLYAGRRPTPA